jgi:hypothetical protein
MNDEELMTDALKTKTRILTETDRQDQPLESEWTEVVRKRPVRGSKTTRFDEKKVVVSSHNQKIIPS